MTGGGQPGSDGPQPSWAAPSPGPPPPLAPQPGPWPAGTGGPPPYPAPGPPGFGPCGPPPQRRRPRRGPIVGLVLGGIALLVVGALAGGGAVWAAKSSDSTASTEPTHDNHVDEAAQRDAESVDLAKQFVTDLSTYSPTDTSGLDRAIGRTCPGSPTRNQLTSTVTSLRQILVQSKITAQATVLRAVADDGRRTSDTVPVVVVYRAATTAAGGAEKSQQPTVEVVVRAAPAGLCVDNLELFT